MTATEAKPKEPARQLTGFCGPKSPMEIHASCEGAYPNLVCPCRCHSYEQGFQDALMKAVKVLEDMWDDPGWDGQAGSMGFAATLLQGLCEMEPRA